MEREAARERQTAGVNQYSEPVEKFSEGGGAGQTGRRSGDFTWSERVEIVKAREAAEREAARERMEATQGNKQIGMEKFAEPDKGRALDKLAAAVGRENGAGYINQDSGERVTAAELTERRELCIIRPGGRHE